MRLPALLALALALPAPAAAAPRGDEHLLPAGGAVAGWQAQGAARVYSGSELYELIDGGAEIYFEHGFERVTVRQYGNRADEIRVELYAMRNPAAALGIYLARCGAETPAAGFDERHTAGRHELLLVRNRFYAVVSDLTGRGQRADALLAFARILADRLPAREPVPVLDLLPREGRVPGSERLIRGPLALQPFVLLGEDDALQLAGRVTAVAAGYQAASGRTTLILVPYADAAAARRAFEHLLANLDSEIRPLTRSAERLVFRDYSGKYGEVRLSDARLELTLGLTKQP